MQRESVLSHANPAAQSVLAVQLPRQVPWSPSQRYAPHGVTAPVLSLEPVRSSVQVAPTALHTAATQSWSFVQSAFESHRARQPPGVHAYGTQELSIEAAQLPEPSQLAAATNASPLHAAARQATEGGANAVQTSVFTAPSQLRAAHGSPLPSSQLGRPPRGAPTTGLQVPSLPGRSHA